MNSNLKEIKEELGFMRFKKFFLLEFTKELIRNSAQSDIIKLQTIQKKEKKYVIEGAKEKIKERIKTRQEEEKIKSEEERITNAKEIEDGKTMQVRSIMHSAVGMFESQNPVQSNPFEKTFQKSIVKVPRNMKIPQKRVRAEDPFKKLGLWIPDSKLPAHIQYIKPVPINMTMELGKLNPLINDPMVRMIECYGPGENIIVQGGMGTKKTAIILDKEEINTIIDRFSRETKIPVKEGIFKVVAGKLMFLAIISQTVGSKFTIKKMIQEQPPQRYRS